MSKAKSPKTIVRLACVPEQVNIPVSIVTGRDVPQNIDLKIVSVPEGTGRMLEMLENNEADVAMTVTDAFIVARGQQRAVELAGVWVSSPLVWAIAASPALPEDCHSLGQLMEYRRRETNDPSVKLRVGISRPGSGSHTMASYMAMLHDLDYQNGLEFFVANNFAGLREGILNETFDVFLWETFTTKPWFDTNDLRKLGDVPTPWPAFSLVTSSHHLTPEVTAAIKGFLFPALAESAAGFVSNPYNAVREIIRGFGHSSSDAALWLSRVHYNDANMAISGKVFNDSVHILKSVGLVPSTFKTETLWERSPIAAVDA